MCLDTLETYCVINAPELRNIHAEMRMESQAVRFIVNSNACAVHYPRRQLVLCTVPAGSDENEQNTGE
jgi:hypothetical protein